MTNEIKRILIVEDNTDEAYLINREIQKAGDGYECSVVDSFSEFQKKFQEGNWDAIIADYRLSDFNGKDVLDYVRVQDENIPFIFVSGMIGEEFAVELMKAKASDYIMKDRLTRLPIALRKEIEDATFKRKALNDLALIKQLSLVAKHTTNHVVITNAREEIEWVNEAFEKTFGYTLAEVKGKVPGSFLQGPETESGTAEFMRQKIKIRESFSAEIINYSKAGEKLWIELYVEPLKNEEGEVEKFFSIQYDITEKKAHEAALLALNSSLEDKVLERTAALELLNDDLKSFNHTLANGLQKPVNLISRWVDVLFKYDSNDLPEEIKKSLEEIKKNAHKASREINQLLLYSTAAQKALNKSKCEISDLLYIFNREFVHIQKDALEKITIEGDLLPCYADVSMVYHVLKNLLSNAFKFTTKETHPMVKISSKAVGDMVVYSIEDNGVGFNTRYYDMLFKTFSRLHAESEFEGNGIGLSIAKKFVERNGGEIWAESKVGEGATFSFSVPAWVSPEKKAETTQHG